MNVDGSYKFDQLLNQINEIPDTKSASEDQHRLDAFAALRQLIPFIETASSTQQNRIKLSVAKVRDWANQGSTSHPVHQVAVSILADDAPPTNELVVSMADQVLDQVKLQSLHLLAGKSPDALREFLATPNEAGETPLQSAIQSGDVAFLQKAERLLQDPDLFTQLLSEPTQAGHSLWLQIFITLKDAPELDQAPYLELITYLDTKITPDPSEVAAALMVAEQTGNKLLQDCLLATHAAHSPQKNEDGYSFLDCLLEAQSPNALPLLLDASPEVLSELDADQAQCIGNILKDCTDGDLRQAVLRRVDILKQAPAILAEPQLLWILASPSFPPEVRLQIVREVGSFGNENFTLLHSAIQHAQPHLINDFSDQQLREICQRDPSPFVVAARHLSGTTGVQVMRVLLTRLKAAGMTEPQIQSMLVQGRGVWSNNLLHFSNDALVDFLEDEYPQVIGPLLRAENQASENPLRAALTSNHEEAMRLLHVADPELITQTFNAQLPALALLLERFNTDSSALLREILTSNQLGDYPLDGVIAGIGNADRLSPRQRVATSFMLMLLVKQLPGLLQMAQLPDNPSAEDRLLTERALRLVHAVADTSREFEQILSFYKTMPASISVPIRYEFARQIQHAGHALEGSERRSWDYFVQEKLPNLTATGLETEQQRSALIQGWSQSRQNLRQGRMLERASQWLWPNQHQALIALIPNKANFMRYVGEDAEDLEQAIQDIDRHYAEAVQKGQQAVFENMLARMDFSSVAAVKREAEAFAEQFQLQMIIQAVPNEGLALISASRLPFTVNVSQLRQLPPEIRQQWLQQRSRLSNTVQRGAERTVAQGQWLQAEALVADWAADRSTLMTKDRLAELHRCLAQGQENNGVSPGVYRKEGVEVVEGLRMLSYVQGRTVPMQVAAFMEWLDQSCAELDQNSEPAKVIATAAKAFQWLVSIHPFSDGNGRISRLMMDYVLLRYGILPPVLASSDVAVYAELPSEQNVTAERALTLVWDGVQESYQLFARA